MQPLKAIIVSAPAAMCEQLDLAPELLQEYGMGVGAAAVMLLVGDNPERIRSETAPAKLWGACPIPVSNGRTSRHRLNRST